jgi:hypothetical protein
MRLPPPHVLGRVVLVLMVVAALLQLLVLAVR